MNKIKDIWYEIRSTTMMIFSTLILIMISKLSNCYEYMRDWLLNRSSFNLNKSLHRKIHAIMEQEKFQYDASVFNYLTQEELETFVSTTIHVKAGDIFIKDMELNDEIYIIADGEVDIVNSDRFFVTLTKGQVIFKNRLSCVSSKNVCPTLAYAKSDTVLLVVKKALMW